MMERINWKTHSEKICRKGTGSYICYKLCRICIQVKNRVIYSRWWCPFGGLRETTLIYCLLCIIGMIFHIKLDRSGGVENR